jgi:hypothetical protein
LEIHIAAEQKKGHMLCFLPGQDDCESAKKIFETALNNLTD